MVVVLSEEPQMCTAAGRRPSHCCSGLPAYGAAPASLAPLFVRCVLLHGPGGVVAQGRSSEWAARSWQVSAVMEVPPLQAPPRMHIRACPRLGMRMHACGMEVLVLVVHVSTCTHCLHAHVCRHVRHGRCMVAVFPIGCQHFGISEQSLGNTCVMSWLRGQEGRSPRLACSVC